MTQWLSLCIETELAIDARITGSGSTSEEHEDAEFGTSGRFIDEEGRAFEAIMLIAHDMAQPRIAAILALHVRAGARTMPSRELRAEIADQMLEHGDVQGVALSPRLAELKTDETAGA